jgi:hypothetical protein
MHSTVAHILFVFGLASSLQGTLAQTTMFMMNNAGNFNCPGVLRNNNGNDNKGYCCVGGELDLSTCQGWPICTGSSWEPKPITCVTTVPITAPDYNAQIKSARSKFMLSITGDSVSSTTVDESSNDQGVTASSTSTAVGSTQTVNGVSAVMPSLSGVLVGGLIALWIGL